MRKLSIKSFFTIFLIAFVLLVGITMIACGDDENESKSYRVTVAENELVDISADYQLALGGTLVTVTVEPTLPEVYVINVYANDTPCTKVDDTTYTFEIVADTTVTVETEMRYQEINESEYASASSLNPTQIIKTSDSYLQGWMPYLTYNFSESIYKGDNLRSLTSSNQAVIPDEALSADFFNSQNRDNGYVDGVNVYIDTDKIDYGETFIIFEFKEIQVSSAPTCRLVKKIEVVHEEDYDYSANVMAESVTLDFSEVQSYYDDFNYFGILFSDDDVERVRGVDWSKYGFELEEVEPLKVQWTTDGVIYYIAAADMPMELTVNFNYLLNHRYGLDVFGVMDDDIDNYENRIYLSINERLSGGVMYSGGALTYENPNTSITLNVVAR